MSCFSINSPLTSWLSDVTEVYIMERLAILQGHLLNLLIYDESPHALLVTLNRPKVLNTLNTELLEKFHSILNRVGRRTLIIQGIGKNFCAGGDVVALVTHRVICPVFLQTEYSVLDRMHRSDNFSVGIMRGLTMGGGAGLAGTCKARVAMKSTIWAFPESYIGIFPDVGAQYFLPRLKSRAVGLYLSLTGERVNGADCYYLGIATHYVDEANVPQLIEALGISSDPVQTLEQYHLAPGKSHCQVLKQLPLIEELFTDVRSAEQLFSRLASHPSPWAKKTLSALQFMNPLALKVNLSCFELGSRMTHREALSLEYNSIIQLIFVDNRDFDAGVRDRLIKKKKNERPKWRFDRIEDVTEADVRKCLENPDGPHFKPRDY